MKKYFVIGNPINHSLSPKLHNYWFKENNIDAIYDKKKIEEKNLQSIIYEVKEKKINGINVTVPFKKAVIPYLDKLSPEAEQTQSVNTIILSNDNLVGHNTDILGFDKAIKNLNFDMQSKKILILGAGGVVPSLIVALNKMEASEIIISNRTSKKAEDLKIQFNKINIVRWGEVPDFDMIINATSLGLKNGNDFNFNFSNTKKDAIYIDTIYNPLETKTFKYLKEEGRRVFNGLDMFIYQGQK